jgi:hypothetical protein
VSTSHLSSWLYARQRLMKALPSADTTGLAGNWTCSHDHHQHHQQQQQQQQQQHVSGMATV